MAVSRLGHAGDLPTTQSQQGLPYVIQAANLHRSVAQSPIGQLREANNRPLPSPPSCGVTCGCTPTRQSRRRAASASYSLSG